MLQPLGDRILIRPDEQPPASLILHVVEETQPETSGTVVQIPQFIHLNCPECGHPVHRVASVRVGDTVVFSHKSGQEIQIDAVRYLILRESDILAVLEGVS